MVLKLSPLGVQGCLRRSGVPTLAIDDITGFPEMLDGRVKTLHPNIHGGLLAKGETKRIKSTD